MSGTSFDFPKRVIYGTDSIGQIQGEATRLMGKQSQLLLVTDKNMSKIGLADRVRKLLEEAGHHVEVFDTIEGEPTLDVANSATEFARKGSFAGVVGVGGGSSMDMAKMASVAYTNPGPIKDYIAYMVDKVEKKPLPKILVPTTSGTGSEASSYAVITEGNFKSFMNSSSIVAEVAILDPTVTKSAPPKVTASSGLDALAHAIEAILSWKADTFSDTFSFRAVELIARNIRRAYHHGGDLEARAAMSQAAFYAGIAITTPAAVNIGHCIAETLGPRYHLPHGLSCGVTLPYIMKYNAAAWPERVASLAGFFLDEPASETQTRAHQAVMGVRSLLADMDISLSLKDYGVSQPELQEMAKFVAKEQQYNYDLPALNPRTITEANALKLFAEMYDGVA